MPSLNQETMKLTINIPKYGGNKMAGGSADPKRAGYIIKQVIGGRTLKDLGQELGLTRQRVEQIYFKFMGQCVRPLKRAKFLMQRKAELAKVKFYCLICHNPVTFGNARSRRTFCAKCVPPGLGHNERVAARFKCSGCGIMFHPIRTTEHHFMGSDPRYTGRRFHNAECFHNYIGGPR